MQAGADALESLKAVDLDGHLPSSNFCPQRRVL
jgi:hypothetical protein